MLYLVIADSQVISVPRPDTSRAVPGGSGITQYTPYVVILKEYVVALPEVVAEFYPTLNVRQCLDPGILENVVSKN